MSRCSAMRVHVSYYSRPDSIIDNACPRPQDVNKAFDVVSKEVARTGLPFAGLVNNAALTRVSK